MTTAAYVLGLLVAGVAWWAWSKGVWLALGEGDDPAIDSYSGLMAARVTQPADTAKARRTWRRSTRVYLAERKGEVL